MKFKVKHLIIALIALVAVVCLIAVLSHNSAKQADRDEAYHAKLLGSWVLLDDPYAEYDDDGNIIAFSVYEFTDTQTYYHKVGAQMTSTGLVNEYTIEDEKYTVVVDGVKMKQGIDFKDNGNLVLFTDTSSDEFRKLTDEEIEEYGVPLSGNDASSETSEETVEETASETAAEE